jgi:dTDP-4-amino-4,6-dideoxygalactose transaminase
VKHLFFVSNGTIALQIAIKALDLHGDIITTPFSYVATTSSIVWEGCRPVFADIDRETWCMNPDLIEAAATAETSAILATHIYGYPCNVEHIQEIANRHHFKVIYDAAHAFGVRYKDCGVANYGDISTLSFHATKLFHTVEGGAVATNDDELAQRIAYMRNFGHKGLEEFWGLGINGKNSELHAAMGLAILPRVGDLIKRNESICDHYDVRLKLGGLLRPKIAAGAIYNYAYYPVLLPSENMLSAVMTALNEQNIYPKRYFYPSLNTLPYLTKTEAPVGEDISRRVLCLPLYSDLEERDVAQICEIVNYTLAQ